MKKLLTLLSFIISFGALLGVMAQNPGLAHSPALLTFTSEGCQFAKGIGLQAKLDSNGCTATVRFDYYRLGGGGSIRLDDDRVVRISGASLLAWQPAPDHDIPDTPAQNGALLRYWIFMLLALSFFVVGMRSAFGKSNKTPKSDTVP